jgi:hypothetical protein
MRYVTYDSDDPIIVTPLPEIGESIRVIVDTKIGSNTILLLSLIPYH